MGVFVMPRATLSNKNLWSVDALVFKIPSEGYSQGPKNVLEEQDVFTMWAACLIFVFDV